MRGFRLLGIVAKSETVIVLCAIVFVMPLSPVLVSILSKPEYSIYSYSISTLVSAGIGVELLSRLGSYSECCAKAICARAGCRIQHYTTLPYIYIYRKNGNKCVNIIP